MNKRIQKFIDECTEWITGTIDGDVECFDKEKFALLIVGECINTIKLSAETHMKQNATEEEIQAILLKVEGALTAMTSVAKHFGVES